jgi:hypothetical protein
MRVSWGNTTCCTCSFGPLYQAPQPRHTTDAILQYFAALRSLIERAGVEQMQEQIMQIWRTNAHNNSEDACRRELREWILRLPLAPADSLHNTRPVHHRKEPDDLDPVHDKENRTPGNQPVAVLLEELRGLSEDPKQDDMSV